MYSTVNWRIWSWVGIFLNCFITLKSNGFLWQNLWLQHREKLLNNKKYIHHLFSSLVWDAISSKESQVHIRLWSPCIFTTSFYTTFLTRSFYTTFFTRSCDTPILSRSFYTIFFIRSFYTTFLTRSFYTTFLTRKFYTTFLMK